MRILNERANAMPPVTMSMVVFEKKHWVVRIARDYPSGPARAAAIVALLKWRDQLEGTGKLVVVRRPRSKPDPVFDYYDIHVKEETEKFVDAT